MNTPNSPLAEAIKRVTSPQALVHAHHIEKLGGKPCVCDVCQGKAAPLADDVREAVRAYWCDRSECGDPEPHKHYCDCGVEVPEEGQCWGCYREDPMNHPLVDEDRS